MLKTLLVAGCLAICILPLKTANFQAEHPSATAIDADVDAIYSAVIDWRTAHPGEGPKAGQLVLLDTTEKYSCFGSEAADCTAKTRNQLTGMFGKDMDLRTIDDYMERNAEKKALSKTIPTTLAKSYITEAEQSALFKKGVGKGWQAFYAKYPKAGGIIGFSQIGFNENHDRALLYSSIGCGGLCGTGHYHFLRKENGRWILAANSMVWIS